VLVEVGLVGDMSLRVETAVKMIAIKTERPRRVADVGLPGVAGVVALIAKESRIAFELLGERSLIPNVLQSAVIQGL
jgi:hypothetical protein